MDRIKSPRWSVIKQNRIKGTKNTIALLLKSLFSDHFLIIHRILKLEVLKPQWPLTLFYLFELIRTTKFWSKSVHSLVPILGHCANERNGPMCPSVCWPIVSKFWDQYHWPKLSVGQVGQWNHDQGITRARSTTTNSQKYETYRKQYPWLIVVYWFFGGKGAVTFRLLACFTKHKLLKD